MKKGKKPGPKPSGKRQQQSVFREAWENMQGDLDKVLPEKLQGKRGKKKFVLWLFILELLVLGVIGKLVYEWLVGS